jgi:cell wall-active antibiotic response 4TMS protein YvqF
MRDTGFDESELAMSENEYSRSAPPAPRAPSSLAQRSLRGIVSILGNRGVKGPWTVPPLLRVATILGNTEIDLREAQLENEVSVIEVMCVMGNVGITVPPDVIVECDGEQFLGSFEVHRKKDARNDVPPAGARRVRVIGKAIMGNCEVIVRRRG